LFVLMTGVVANMFSDRSNFMRAAIETFEAVVSRSSQMHVRPAASLRLPVTAGNRALLRRLRAAELADWEAGRPSSPEHFPGQIASLENRQSEI